MPHISLLSGKRVRSGTVLSQLCDHLRGLSVDVAVHVVELNGRLPPQVLASQLLVQRALGPAQLSTLLPLEHAGVRCCNRIDATIAVRDRHRTFQALADSAIPVPQTTFVASWHDVLREAKGRRVVVKCAAEFTGRGGAVLEAPDGRLPPDEPFDGPYLLQEYIAGDGRDYKVYVAGDQARGLIKSCSPELQVEQFEVDRELSALARRVGTTLRLEIYGVDVLYGPDGAVVVDVNPFPGFRGIPDAAELVGAYLLAL